MKTNILALLLFCVLVATLNNFVKLVSYQYFTPEASAPGMSLFKTQEAFEKYQMACKFEVASEKEFLKDNLLEKNFEIHFQWCDVDEKFEEVILQPLTSDPQVAVDFFYSWASENQLDSSKLEVTFVNQAGEEIKFEKN